MISTIIKETRNYLPYAVKFNFDIINNEFIDLNGRKFNKPNTEYGRKGSWMRTG